MGVSKDYIEIADFSPGIFGDRFGFQDTDFDTPTNRTANPANSSFRQLEANGAATIEGTFGCYADKSGALAPLPRGQYISQPTWLPFSDPTHTGTGYHPAGYVGYYLLDARLISGVTDNVGQETWVWMSFGTFMDPANANGYRQLVWCVLAGIDFDRWETPHWGKSAAYVVPAPVRNLPSGNIVLTRSVTGDRDAEGLINYGVDTTQNTVVFIFHSSPVGRASGQMGDEYQQWSSGTAIPADELALTNYALSTGQTNYPSTVDQTPGVGGTPPSPYLGIFPNPRDRDQSLPRYVGNGQIIPGFLMIEHQGRNVIACHTSKNFGGNYATVDIPDWLIDRLFWSDPLNPALVFDVVAPDTVQFPLNYSTAFSGDDNPNLIGTLATMNAGELLVVKYGKGAILLRGDLNNYEAIALPYVESTYGIIGHGVGTPIGWVYGSRNGIFAWNEGPISEKLSMQIDGFFYDHTFGPESVPYRGNRHRFGYWHPWVCIPYDYLYSIESKSWWRLEDPADTSRRSYNIYDVSSITGDLYGFEWKMDPGDIPKIKRYELDDPRDTYSWRSHPLVETRDTMFSVEECELTISTIGPTRGEFTATVTLDGFDIFGTALLPVIIAQDLPIPNVLDFFGAPQVYMFQPQPAFNARYVQVTVAFAPTPGSTGFQGPAPKLHKIRIGRSDRARTPFAPYSN